MDNDAIKAEIAKPEYAGLSNVQIATAINATTRQRPRRAPMEEIVAHVEANGLLDALLKAQQQPIADPALQATTARAVRLFTVARLTTLMMDDPAVFALVQSTTADLVKAGTWTQQQADGLIAKCHEEYPAWQDLGGREIDHGDILAANGERWEDHAKDVDLTALQTEISGAGQQFAYVDAALQNPVVQYLKPRDYGQGATPDQIAATINATTVPRLWGRGHVPLWETFARRPINAADVVAATKGTP